MMEVVAKEAVYVESLGIPLWKRRTAAACGW